MCNLLDAYLCGMVVLGELLGVIVFSLLLQLICYQCFNINLYKGFNRLLRKLDKYLTNLFYK